MISSFSRAVPVLFGPGASMRTGLEVKQAGVQKVLCVYDQGIKSAGIADGVINNLKEAGLRVVVFEEVQADPSDTLINEAAQMATAEKVDGIVGVGGGSSMDMAKAINVLLTNPPPINLYYVATGNEHKPGKFMVLIPTTAGTGSEATPISVVSDIPTQSKKGVIGPATVATLAIVDPELLLGLPSQITASTGMDAFSHAVEALTSKGMNPMSDLLAEKAVSLIVENLGKTVKDGSNMAARTNMSFASLIAGMAFSDALVHWGHAIAHTIGAHHHVPHGIACAVTLPAVVEYVADAVPDKVQRVAQAMGLTIQGGLPPEELGIKVADAIRDLNREVGIPSLKSFKIEKGSLEQLISGVLTDDCAMFGPKQASADQVLAMMKKAYEY